MKATVESNLTAAFWFQIKVAMKNKLGYNLVIIIGIQLIVTQTNTYEVQ